ncbi:uncharacterized protein LOC119340464 isoform X2 [Triticum dicoccoides]|uniref:uncharacterized protein LOC119340464 isoform X2 n=1 Tax=Triticum dicoccoides TaxID=85692 RepID=UPI0018918B6F|nr:uncharacterized protein LOC119340464 isoform X2 [Triticum dicoccoides]
MWLGFRHGGTSIVGAALATRRLLPDSYLAPAFNKAPWMVLLSPVAIGCSSSSSTRTRCSSSTRTVRDSFWAYTTKLTSWHLLVTFCMLHTAQRLHFFEPKPIDAQIVISFGFLNGISIGLLNLCLGFYQMTKLAIIPFTMLLETIFLSKKFRLMCAAQMEPSPGPLFPAVHQQVLDVAGFIKLLLATVQFFERTMLY